jgi:hypothetical protein
VSRDASEPCLIAGFAGSQLRTRFRITQHSHASVTSGSVRATCSAGSSSVSLKACIAAGLVGGEGFAVDASLIVADANKQRSIPGTE